MNVIQKWLFHHVYFKQTDRLRSARGQQQEEKAEKGDETMVTMVTIICQTEEDLRQEDATEQHTYYNGGIMIPP